MNFPASIGWAALVSTLTGAGWWDLNRTSSPRLIGRLTSNACGSSLLGIGLIAMFAVACLTPAKALDSSNKPNPSDTANPSPAKGRSGLPYALDLKPFYDKVFQDPAGSDSAYLGYAGRKTIDGLPFDINGHIVLFGKSSSERNKNYPDDIPGIKIDRKFDELHLIHAAQWREYAGCPIAVVRLHYTNGTIYDFPIRDKFQVDDWSRLFTENDEVVADPDTKIIWRGKGGAKGTGRLFKTLLRNPYPGLKVDTMELISTYTASSYVLVAATVAQSDLHREVTPPMPLLVSNPKFDGVFTVTVVDQVTGKPLSGAEVNIAWVTQDISLVADSIITSADGVAVVRFPKASTADLRVQVVKDGYLTCNDNWQQGWNGPVVPDAITYQLTPGQNPAPASATAPENLGESRNQVPDAGRLYHALVYQQTSAEAPKLVTNPYRFIAEVRNAFPKDTGTVSLPDGTSWATNPVTVVAPANLGGEHFLYAQGFATLADFLANFPNGNYNFNVGRTYPSGATSSYTLPVAFTDSIRIPSAAPAITNTTWKSGALILPSSSAIIHYTHKPHDKFSWELVGKSVSAGTSEGAATGTLDLTGYLRPGETYQAQLRLVNPDTTVTAADPDAPAGESNYAYTYSTFAATIVHFTITTPSGTP